MERLLPASLKKAVELVEEEKDEEAAATAPRWQSIGKRGMGAPAVKGPSWLLLLGQVEKNVVERENNGARERED